MALTMYEREERYYKLVSEKGERLYSAWLRQSAPSKAIVAKAEAFAHDKRLKTDAIYRFHAFAFLYALELRVKKRYGSFFRIIFHLFAYFREKRALAWLKRVLGFYPRTSIREMLAVEVERLPVLLSEKEDAQAKGGGKRSEMGEDILEEELESFFNACMTEDLESAETDVTAEKEDALEAQDETISVKTEVQLREKISVQEFEIAGASPEQKENKPQEKSEQKTKEERAQDIPNEVKQEEKATEKSAMDTSILMETIELEQPREEEIPSPFPVFRDTADDVVQAVKKEASVTAKEEIKSEPTEEKGEKTENADRNVYEEKEEVKSPFPVFRDEKGNVVKAVDQPIEKSVEKPMEKFEQPTGDLLETFAKIRDERFYKPMEFSEENKARIALNTTMSDDQISNLAGQIKEAARLEMEQEENEWREQISVADSGEKLQPSAKAVAPEQGDSVALRNPNK